MPEELIWTCKTSLRVWYEMHGYGVIAVKSEKRRLWYGFNMTRAEATKLEREFKKSKTGEYEHRRQKVIKELKEMGRVDKDTAGRVAANG